jgi:protein disulfide-isomerase A6
MQFVLLLILLALCLVSFSTADVLHLTAENFDEHVTHADGPILVEFYAPWCGHCKNLAPEWDIAGKTFQPEDGITIAAFDATLSSEIAGRYDIKGYPTIKYFQTASAAPEDYQGGRTADQIVKWVNDKIGTHRRIKAVPSAVTTLIGSADFSKHVTGKKAALVEFYAPWCGHCKQLTPIYEELALAFAGEKDVVIAKLDATEADNEELATTYEIQGFPTIKFFPADSSEAEDYQGARDLDSLIDFMNRKTGTQRTKDGSLIHGTGTVKVLNEIIEVRNGFVDAALLDAITAASRNFEEGSKDREYAQIYMSIAKKIIDKGSDYLENELVRVGKMIANPSVLAEKKTAFQLKHNVLSAYYAIIVSQ